VEHEASRIEVTLAAGLSDELHGDQRRVSGCDSPPDDATAPDIHYQIQKQVYAPHGRGQPGDVPAPDLIGTGSSMERGGTGGVSSANDPLAYAKPISTVEYRSSAVQLLVIQRDCLDARHSSQETARWSARPAGICVVGPLTDVFFVIGSFGDGSPRAHLDWSQCNPGPGD